MSDRLAGKLALVTAAGQGIGRAIAASFAVEGAEVIATDVDERKLEGLACARRLPLDVRSSAAVEVLRSRVLQEHHHGLDILVNCAGFVHHGSVLQCSEADWDLSFDLNVKSMHRTIGAFLPGMLTRGDGVILNISSTVSSIKGVPERYVYGATKAAVIGLTKAIAADFITRGIRANAICPGTIDSPSLQDRIRDRSVATGKPPEEIERAFIARQPMGRLGRPEDVAALAVFLASDEASYITGQCHLVDGGMAL